MFLIVERLDMLLETATLWEMNEGVHRSYEQRVPPDTGECLHNYACTTHKDTCTYCSFTYLQEHKQDSAYTRDTQQLQDSHVAGFRGIVLSYLEATCWSHTHMP